jgi:PAS domain S-box-containing protein
MTPAKGWRRLGVKLLAASLVVEVLMLGLLLATTSAVSSSSLDALFQRRLVEVEKLFNASLAGPLAARDLGTLQEVLDALRAPQAISYLVLLDDGGRRVAASGWPDTNSLPAPRPDLLVGRRVDAILPITLAGARYGTLHYGVETELLAQAHDTLLNRGAMIAGIGIAVSAMLLWAVSMLLTRRLVRLSEAVEAIAEGDLATRVPVDSNDEVGRLAERFNLMADGLDARLRALTASEEKFSKAFAASPDALVITGPGGAILEANAAFERIFGAPRELILGKPLDRFCDGECGRRLTETICGGEAITDLELAIPGPDGEFSSCLVSADSILLAGAPCRIAILRDITQRKATEEALARSNRDLEQFAYVSSHDLREPLRMVSAYVDLLDRRYGAQLDDDARQFIAFARDGARRMDRLILDLLEYSRVSRDETPLAPVDLAAPLRAALDNLTIALRDSGATVELLTTLPRVAGNTVQLTRLFQNLIGNAIKYSTPDRTPQVSVSAVVNEHYWTIAVADNGIGIEPQYFERIFQLFQRLHGRDAYDGTGIGLAVCKRIVERHNGQIWVETGYPCGSTFYFTLPAMTP